MTPHKKQNHSLICTVFSMFNVVMARIDYFQDIYIIETKLDFVSVNDKNLQRRRRRLFRT